MAAPSPWMLHWQEMPDDPILYQPAWLGGEEDAASEGLSVLPVQQSTDSETAPAGAEDVE